MFKFSPNIPIKLGQIHILKASITAELAIQYVASHLQFVPSVKSASFFKHSHRLSPEHLILITNFFVITFQHNGPLALCHSKAREQTHLDDAN